MEILGVATPLITAQMKTFLYKIKSYHLIIETSGSHLTLEGENGRVRLRPKESEVFQFLPESAIKTPEAVVTRNELINRFWPEPSDLNKYVEPNKLDKAMSGVRGALKKA